MNPCDTCLNCTKSIVIVKAIVGKTTIPTCKLLNIPTSRCNDYTCGFPTTVVEDGMINEEYDFLLYLPLWLVKLNKIIVNTFYRR